MRRRLLPAALILAIVPVGYAQSGTMTTVMGLSTVQNPKAAAAPDPTIAVGTTEFCEHVNSIYQCWYKSGPNANQPVKFWGSTNPKSDVTPWSQNGNNGGNTPHCPLATTPNAQLLHDNVYNRWILQKRIHNQANGHDYMCVAISNIEDVGQTKRPTFNWFAIEFDLDTVIPTNSHGHFYYADYPQAGLWQTSTSSAPPYPAAKDQALWISYDLQDIDNSYNITGVLICAVDLAGMRASSFSPWTNQAQTPACVVPYSLGAFAQRRSWVPADNADTTPAPSSDGEMFTYLISPSRGNRAYLTNPNRTQGVEQWSIDWTSSNPAPVLLNTWDLPSTQANGDQPACFNPYNYYNTVCIPQPSTATTGIYLDSVGDRMQQPFRYTANGGQGGIWTSSRAIQISPNGNARSQSEADIRILGWNASNPAAIAVAADYPIVDPSDPNAYVFLPSVARDHVGNLQGILGVSGAGPLEHPGLESFYYIASTSTVGSYGYIADPAINGDAQELAPLSYRWGDWSGAVLDPSDACTVWVVGEFLQNNRTTKPYWQTKIAQLPPADNCH